MNSHTAHLPVRSLAASVLALLVAFIALTPIASTLAAPPAEPPRDVQDGIRKGLAYLELEGLDWRRERKCAACHHVMVMVSTQREARGRGLKVNEEGLKEATEFLLAGDNSANILADPDVPFPGDENFAKLGPLYALLTFRENRTLPTPDPDKTLPRWTAYLRSKQQAGGLWLPHTGRPPVSLNDEESMTLAVLYSLGAETDAETKQTQIQARQWLAKNFKGTTPQALNLSILAGYEEKAATTQLLERQNADGGWSQTKELPSDAHTTGQALYAMLSRRTLGPDHPAAVNARNFLLKTQTPDGSWAMTSRPRVDRPQEGPAKNLDPISYFATGWAVLALLQYLPPAP